MVRRDPGGRRLVWWGLVGAAIALAVGGTVQQLTPSSSPSLTAGGTSRQVGMLDEHGRLAVAQAVQGLPLMFEENVGQADPSVKYLARGSGYAMLLREHDLLLNLRAYAAPAAPAQVRLTFEGAGRPTIRGGLPLTSHANYLVGADRGRWHTHVAQYREVLYRGLYDGIDARFHGTQGTLKFDLLVSPGTAPDAIAMRLDGADHLRLDRAGDLVLTVGGGEVRKPRPVIYQDIDGRRVPVDGGYRLQGNRVTFRLGQYDRRHTLVIDPTVDSATYLGGTLSDQINAVAYGPNGDIYVAGETTSSDLVLVNPLQGSPTGTEAVLAKYDSTLTTASYITYYGGAGTDRAQAVAGDAAGALYVAGTTLSPDLPLASALQGALVGPTSGFFAKLSADGSALTYASYFGNNQTGQLFNFGAMVIDSTGSMYLAGSTGDATWQQVGLTRPYAGGTSDGWAARIAAAGDTVLWSTLVGGSAADTVDDLAVGPLGNTHLVGTTSSNDFPTVSPSQPTFGGISDSFLTILSTTPTIAFSTFLGGSGIETSAGSPARIVLTSTGTIYVAGATSSADFPLRGVPLSSTPAPAYLARFASGGSSFSYSTYLNNAGSISDLAVDTATGVYVLGTTGAGPAQQPQVMQLLGNGGTAGFTFGFGGTNADQANSFSWRSGFFVVGGITASTDFPQTAGHQQAANGGANDGFVAVLSDPFPQPDLLVRHSSSANLLGNGIYNIDGSNQTATGNTVTSTAAVFPFQVQNDGNVTDSITLTATTAGAGWTARYFDATAGGNDITSAITNAGVPVANLAPGGTANFRVELTPDGTVAVNATQSVLVTSVSGTDTTRRDAVRATATRILGPRLEFTGATGYTADGVQPDSGGIQTSFDFQGLYLNATGATATGVQLVLLKDGAPVAGSPFPMSVLSGSDPVTGVIYHVTVSGLTKGGQYTYRMTGNDGTFPCTGPLTAALQGPVVGNTQPSVSNVAITPAAPLADQDLRVTYTFADADGDADQSSTVAWTINGNPVGGLADPKLLPAARTTMGDQIVAVVTPGDGTDLGAPLASATVTVQTRTLSLVPLGFVGVQGRNVPVTATLRNGANAVVAGELVTFANAGGSIAGGFLTVATDANGQAVSQAVLGLGPNQISATSGGASATVSVTGRPPGTTAVTLLTPQVTADQAATIDVRVADTQTGQAVAGMGVTSAVASGTVSPLNASAVTDATGVAHFTHTFGLGTAQLTFVAGDATINGTIVAVPGAIARSRSTVVLSKDTVPSDGTTSINLVATLKDVNGNPVAGVPGASFRISSSPDLGLAVSFGNSDAQGVATGRLTATRAGTTTVTLQVVDPRNNQLTTLTDTLSLKVLGVFALRLEPGLNLIGSPVQLENTNPTVVFAAVTPLRMARYAADTATYRALNPVQPTEPFNLDPGRAFWLRSSTARTVLLAGDPGATGDWSTKLSGYEWTLASIPTVNAITWDPDRIRISLNDVELGSLTSSPELAASYAWVWNAGRQQNELVISAALGVSGSASAIPAGSGFWLRRGTRTDVSGQVGVVFNVQQLARSRAEGDLPAGPGNWSLALNAAADGLQGSQVTIGVSTRLSRALEIDRPPVPADGALNLELVDPATGRAFGGVLDSLPVTGSRSWRLRLSGDATGPVTLSWPSANRSLPRGYRLVLTDPTTGRQLSLLGNAAMQVELGPDGAAELDLTMSRQTGDRLAIGVQGHPSRSRAASLAVTLNQPADVTLRVVGLGGRVVRQWSAGRLEAGTTPVAWDGLDANGRRVPAGTYRLEAWASDDLGEAATATTVVNVQ